MPTVPAVILAAGFGRRIAARTGGGPKALLDLGGRSLLERSLDALGAAGFDRIVVVTGHAAADIEAVLAGRATGPGLEAVFNEAYASANNIVSLLAAADVVQDGFCLLNSDIVFDPSIVVDLAGRTSGNWMVIDGDEALGVEEMKVHVDAADRIVRISKRLDPAASGGEYIGIARFDATGAASLFEAARDLVTRGGRDLYYEDAVDAAADRLGVGVLWTGGRAWTEVDDEADYQRALGVAAGLDAVADARWTARGVAR